MCDDIRLARNDLGETPWGFRLTGGRDFGTPLLVVKVVGGSIAQLSGLAVGDLVRGINYVPTDGFTHLDAQRAILESGDNLVLNVLKVGGYPEELLYPPEVPVIEVQSPEDKEVEEIGQQQEDLDLAFVIKLDRSGRISTVEEIPTPRSSPTGEERNSTPATGGSGRGSRRKSSGSGDSEKSAPKPKITMTVNDDGPIVLESKDDQSSTTVNSTTSAKTTGRTASTTEQEVTLHEELRVETSLKKTTTEIKERTEEEFIMSARDEIVNKAHQENRELTEEEIAEMMAGEAEVLDEDKGTIGVNFQKFLPKCDFIKDSSVFKALQEEATFKQKTEEQQLEKDPAKRFSTFLIRPQVAKPVPKPRPESTEPFPWQIKMNQAQNPGASPQLPSPQSEGSAFERVCKIGTESIAQATEEVKEKSTEEKGAEKLTLRMEQSGRIVETIEGSVEEEKTEDIEVESHRSSLEIGADEPEQEESKKGSSRSESVSPKSVLKTKKSSSTEIGGSKEKKQKKRVEFVGDEEEELQRLVAEMQDELVKLQRLPIEVQDHLLSVQRLLQEILVKHGRLSQSPVEASGEIDEIIEDELKEEIEEGDIEVETVSSEDKKEDYEEEEIEIKEQEATETESEDAKGAVEEKADEVPVPEEKEPPKEDSTTETKPQSTEDGTTDEEGKTKPGLPLTPQIRPLVLPGGRKWFQPQDAYTEEYIAETLVSQSEVLVGTTIGVNFRKYIPPKFDTSNSAVARLIKELEEKSKLGIPEKGIAGREKIPSLEEYYHPPIDKRHFYAATLASKRVKNAHDLSL